MDVRIGLANTPREITFETELTAEEVIATINKAVESNERFTSFKDSRASSWYVNAAQVTFVEFGSAGGRRVGFVG